MSPLVVQVSVECAAFLALKLSSQSSIGFSLELLELLHDKKTSSRDLVVVTKVDLVKN